MRICRTADEIAFADHIRPGDTVVVSQGLAEPVALTAALVAQRKYLGHPKLFIGPSFSSVFKAEHREDLSLVSYCGMGDNHDLVAAGMLDILPANYSTFASLFAQGALRSDVVLLLLAEDGRGGYNTGIVCDYMIQAARQARIVIAEISDRLPWTPGAELPPDIRPDIVVRTSREPLTLPASRAGEADRHLAAHVAGLIPDGATLEIGIGTIPDLVLTALSGHRDLGLHSGAIGDAVADLMEQGVVTNARKPFDRGISIACMALGTRRIFDFINRNPAVRLSPSTHTHAAPVLAQLPRLMAVNAAVEVDLTGQVNSEIAGNRYIGAVGGLADFSRGAMLSEGGRSIVMVSSTARKGTVSRIVGRLPVGVATLGRNDADTFVSEWGVAELRGTTLRQRIPRMCAIADPRFREDLERQGHLLLKEYG